MTSSAPTRTARPRAHRSAGAALLAAITALVAVATLTPGSPERLEPTSIACLVCGSAGSADVVRNVLLFLPVGIATALLGWRWPRAVLAGFLLSLTVESLQYFVVVGRDPSLSDLVTNTLGTALGFMITATRRGWVSPGRAGARRLLLAGSTTWAALLAATALGLQWDAPPLPYQATDLPPPVAGVREFEGTIYARSLDGLPPTDADDGAALAAAIGRGQLEVGAIVGPMYPPGLLRPVVAYYRPDWTSALLFGQQRRDLVLSLRTRAQSARFQGTRFVLYDAFPTLEEAGGPAAAAERMTLTGRVDGARVELAVTRDGRRQAVTHQRRLSLGWTFVAPTLPLLLRLAPLMGALWLAAPLLPLAYWARRALADRLGWRERVATVARCAATAVATLLVVGAAAGLAAPSPAEWVALAIASATGWALGALTSRPS